MLACPWILILVEATHCKRNPQKLYQYIGCAFHGLSDGHSLQATGVEFPAVTHFWEGEAFRSLGAAVRQKKIAFVGVKVNFIRLSATSLTAMPECCSKLQALAWRSPRWCNGIFPEGLWSVLSAPVIDDLSICHLYIQESFLLAS